MSRSAAPGPSLRRSMGAAALAGAALMAAIDEIVFHQLLGWHHFYDRSSLSIGLLSDGLLHAAELVALVAGLFLLADLARRSALAPRAAGAGFFLGLGGFQVFDGIVNHKLLRLHQIRYGVDVVPYDVAWNVAGLTLVAIGAVLVVVAVRSAAPGPGRKPPRAGDVRRDR